MRQQVVDKYVICINHGHIVYSSYIQPEPQDIFIPHCHGNGLVISGVYSGYAQDFLIWGYICEHPGYICEPDVYPEYTPPITSPLPWQWGINIYIYILHCIYAFMYVIMYPLR